MAFKDQWTEEQDDFLRRCAEQRQSTRQAAELLSDLFGISRTKMAVVGRANRKGIVFRGQSEHNARLKAEAAERRSQRKIAKPKADTKVVVANLMRKREQLRVEAERAQPAETLATLLAMEAQSVEAQGDNPGVLFLERSALQCAWPMQGWDALPVTEKRVCGRPVMMRPGPYGAEPTSWCRECRPLVYPLVPRKKLDVKHLTKLDRSVRAA